MGVRCAHGRIARAWERLEIPPHVYNKIPCHISKCRPCHLHLALWFSVLIARLTKSNRSTQRRALSIAVRNGFMHRGTVSASSSSGKAPIRFIFANCSCWQSRLLKLRSTCWLRRVEPKRIRAISNTITIMIPARGPQTVVHIPLRQVCGDGKSWDTCYWEQVYARLCTSMQVGGDGKSWDTCY
jgi:hypothetical protein